MNLSKEVSNLIVQHRKLSAALRGVDNARLNYIYDTKAHHTIGELKKIMGKRDRLFHQIDGKVNCSLHNSIIEEMHWLDLSLAETFEKMRIFSKEQHKVRRELEARLDNLNPFWKRWVAVLEEL